MKKCFLLPVSIFFLSFGMYAQSVCDPTGNIIIYSNYDGGELNIVIDEDVPDLKIGICSYESIDINISGTYVDNVTEVIYAGYDDDGTTSVTGVDAGIVDINVIVPVTLEDPDGYDYMICAYDCDTDYVPGGCNTVDQLTDYFLTTFTGIFRFTHLQYGVFGTGDYLISEGGNCCYDGTAGPSPVDVAITSIITPTGGCNMTDTESVTVTIQNNGPGSVTAIPVNFTVDGSTEVTETAFLTLEAGDSGDFTFSETADLADPDTYSIEVFTSLVSDPEEGNNSLTATVSSLASPIAVLSDNLIVCDEVVLDAGNPGSTYNWSTSETTQTIVVTESGEYSVTVTSPATGCTTSDATDVTVNYSPVASFTYINVGLDIDFTNTSNAASTYTWDFGDGGTSSEENPTYVYDVVGEYTITLTVTNDCGTDVYTSVVQITTAIKEDPLFGKTIIYPNPTASVVIVDMNLDKVYDVHLRLIDAGGKTVMYRNAGKMQNGKIELDLSELNNGVYQLEITAGVITTVRPVTLAK
ncbi:MAG: PKD domain-containing protein [Chitinophagales bacterium]|nr:PKD domain-containing protein [Chitinophagales bacterium]